MKKTSETIVFFGSGPVAAASLHLLLQDFSIEAVITKPRAEHHKGSTPVVELTSHLKLPTFMATDRHSLDELFDTRPVKSRIAVLIDFGIIVSQKVIDFFPLGIINSHFSLLPEWRGADPITFSITSGQEKTGVSLMLLTAGLDEGEIIAQAPYSLSPAITTPQLTEELIDVSYNLVREVLPLYVTGKVQSMPQDPLTPITYSRKLSKKDGALVWSKPAETLEREIRAFIEWPKSYTAFGDLEVIITKAHVLHRAGPSGKRIIVNKKPAIYCGRHTLVIDRLKPAGKKEMTGEAFLIGYKQQFLGF